jgi:hypothetical protein
MSLVVVTMLVAVAIGWARGGSLDRLGALPLRSRRLLVLAFAAQLAGTVVGGPFHPVGLALSGALVVAFLLRNRGVRGTGLIALGLLANAVVVLANGAMPVSVHAAGRAGVTTQPILAGADRRHEIADERTRLPWLGDVVPLPMPVRPEVVSPGDVLVAAGAAQLVVVGMGRGWTLRGRQQGRPRRALPPLPAAPARGGSAGAAASSGPPRRLPELSARRREGRPS